MFNLFNLETSKCAYNRRSLNKTSQCATTSSD